MKLEKNGIYIVRISLRTEEYTHLYYLLTPRNPWVSSTNGETSESYFCFEKSIETTRQTILYFHSSPHCIYRIWDQWCCRRSHTWDDVRSSLRTICNLRKISSGRIRFGMCTTRTSPLSGRCARVRWCKPPHNSSGHTICIRLLPCRMTCYPSSPNSHRDFPMAFCRQRGWTTKSIQAWLLFEYGKKQIY